MAEHYRRFLKGGKYSNMKLKEWAVLDFRVAGSRTPKDRKIYTNICHIVFSKDFAQATATWAGHGSEVWNIIGHKLVL